MQEGIRGSVLDHSYYIYLLPREDRCVVASSNRFLFTSTRRPNLVKESAPIIGFLTSASRTADATPGPKRAKVLQKFQLVNRWLHTAVVFAFETLVTGSVPVSIKNLLLVILSVIKRRQEVCWPGLCCVVSTNGLSCFPASTVVF